MIDKSICLVLQLLPTAFRAVASDLNLESVEGLHAWLSQRMMVRCDASVSSSMMSPPAAVAI